MALKDVVGQDGALGILKGAMKRGRVASSYLFAGEEGTGKRFTAVNFAKALNCLSPVDGDACEKCPSCVKINAGTHPDFKLIKPEKEREGKEIKTKVIVIEQIREIEEAVSLKPFEGAVKAVIVDEAEAMNTQAANAFLKTLEEPSPGSLIVLVSSNPERLPLTIRSRCSRVNFSPLSPEDCAAVVEKALGKGKGKPQRDLGALARLSMGRPGLVIGEDLLKEREAFLETVRKMLRREGRPTWKEREEMREWFKAALVLLRDMAVLRAGKGAEGFLINSDMAPELKKMASKATLESIMACYGKFERLGADLRFNPNKAVVWNYAGSALEAAGISA